MRCKIKPALLSIVAAGLLTMIYFNLTTPTHTGAKRSTSVKVKSVTAPSIDFKNIGYVRLRNLSDTLIDAEKYIAQNLRVRKALQGLEICERYRNESDSSKKTYKVWTSKATSQKDVTLVTVLSADKFKALDRVLNNWAGPVSISIYIGENDARRLIKSVWDRPHLVQRSHIELSIIAGAFEFMPINWMRQVAINQTRTSYVTLFDVDLVPSLTLYETLRNLRKNYSNVKRALVIPAFELNENYKNFTFPRNKSELISYWDRQIIQPFLFSEYNQSHAATDFDKWKHFNDFYKIQYNFRFEPYIFAYKNILPNYDVRFHGRYYNKISLFCQMHFLNFTFDVIPSDFTIHYPHPRAIFKEVYKAHEPCSGALIKPCRIRMEGKTEDSHPKKRRKLKRAHSVHQVVV